ncbi:Uncharacterized protein, UPF0548 family [Promicromonospora umidemergens]|uniref:DUF1990 domain-containing protein n=1 Tax=Promicromonospora umidemergens TaxID=629679 RepID=A0ABP8XP81_9MICO|nr:DUF1990 domain-containing protein [Promicromonospora umidemergens]MCP2282097.1 Uncharacterized protein, UPF0548 family [Promicromonospora umidemergens]
MQLTRPDLARILERSVAERPTADPGWLDAPPARARVLRERVVLGPDASVPATADALFGWRIHRGAGLIIESTGLAATGVTVVQAVRAGPLWFAAPCRVVDAVREPDVAGFTYATLPHHPETGVESFRVVRDGDRVVFEIHAVARHDFWGSRILPRIAHRVQDRVTRGYLNSAGG